MLPPMKIEFATGICNWNATAGNCTGEYATGKTQEKRKQRYSVGNIFYPKANSCNSGPDVSQKNGGAD